MKNIYKKTLGNKKIKEIEKFSKGCWIDIQSPTTSELDYLLEKINLDPELIEDILDANEIPRIEKIDENLLVILKYPTIENENRVMGNFTLIINPNCLVSISSSKNGVIDKVIKDSNELFTTQRFKIFILLMMELAADYQNNIEKIRRTIEHQKKKLDQLSDKQILKLVQFEEILNNFNVALQPIKYIVNKIQKGKLISIFSDDQEILEDMYEEFNQAAEICLLNLKSIVNLRDSYKILLDLKLNKTIKFLTSVTIILTLPTIITSAFGMNVNLPTDGIAGQFEIVVLGTILSVVIASAIFYWKKWL